MIEFLIKIPHLQSYKGFRGYSEARALEFLENHEVKRQYIHIVMF